MSGGVDSWAQRGRRTGAAQLAAVVFLVFAGLIAMHGLGSHGMGGPGAEHGSTDTGVASAMSEMALLGIPEAFVALEASQDAAPMGELCIAVLSFIGVVLLLVRVRRGTARTAHRQRHTLAGRPVVDRTSGPGRPSLAQLSVLRC